MATAFVSWRGALCAIAFLASGPAALAQQPVDPVVTTAVQPAPPIARAGMGSPAFAAALGQLLAGDAPGAYAAARGLADSVERRTIQWAAIRFGEGVDAETVLDFAAEAPDYDFSSTYRSRLEVVIDLETADKDTIIRLLGGQMPRSLDAQIALAEAYLADGQTERAARIARAIWVEDFLSDDGEKKVEARLGALLTQQDYWDRAVHLLMHDRAAGAERIFGHLTPAQQSLARARIAVSRQSAGAAALIDGVDPALGGHPLFFFTKAQWRRDAGDLEGAVAALDQVTSGNVPDAAEFWYERRLIVRRALAEGKPDLAYRAAAHYIAGPEGRLVEARFHAGWVALAYLNDASLAAPHFAAMAGLSTLPDSITQARYWLGRAEEARGDMAAAKLSFEIAARYNHLYYGQLAREALGQNAVSVHPLPDWRGRETIFDRMELVRAVRLLSANGQNAMAEPLVRRLGYVVSEPGDFVLAARLAQEINAHNIAILIADRADQLGHTLDLFHFPKDGIPDGTQLALSDAAAVYAVARQESNFDVDAVSASGARGLMQLMPSTAEDVARQLGLAYSSERLTSDAAYNLLLGSSYLGTQLKRFDNSLVLAAAAYNGGGGNVITWLELYGDPRRADVDAVSWVETIPFIETRRYVQKVMANYLIYRARLGYAELGMQEALKRLPG
ncbi:MAG: lytic transglycosylase domain-containing protein [Alphaproteobacteria bacterium]|nr:lytic transglycosylase domain-containing protein [Alphaproteobacteria bacterium]